MTNISKLALATAAVFALGTAANAADAVMPLPPTPVTPVAPVAAYDWSGFYAGINFGYAMGEAYDEDDDDDFDGFDDIDGFVGGAQVGVNAQFDMFVLGAEADLQASDVWEREEGFGTVALNHFGTVRVRAGVALDAFMPYITGGLAYGQSTVYEGGDFDTQNHLGYTVGAGLEAAVTDDISVRGEYLYTDLGTQTYSTPGFTDEAGLQFHTVRAGINFHF